VIAFAKQRLYNGLGLGAGAFGVPFSAHPAFVAGLPQNQDGKLAIVAANTSTHGFSLYVMTNSSRPDSTAVTFVGNSASSLWSAPTTITQPGGGNLDALDGRIQAKPYQLNGKVWFAHASGFPVVQYGYLDMTTAAATVASAYVTASSQDWNPSIAVTDSGGANPYVFLNWAYVDTGTGTNVSTRISGLSAADAVQSLISVGTTASTGSHGSNTRFGDFSSVSIDPVGTSTCPAGRRALAVQEQFDTSGNWVTRIVRFGFC